MPTRASLKDLTIQASNSTRILQAALVCFDKYGVAKTTMEDIANEAGLGRKTVYRTFATRTILFDTLAMQRVSVFVDSVKAIVDACSTLEEAVVRGSVESLRLVRSDRIFMALVEDSNDLGVERHLIDPESPIFKPMLSIWRDVFARARVRGEWRKGLTDLEAITWLRSIHLLLLLREDLAPKGQAAFLKKFALPAMIQCKPGAG